MSNNPITLQQAFNKAWQTFIVENKPPCVTQTGICTYRNKSTGQRCAIGLVLTDAQIDQLDVPIGRALNENVCVIATRFPAWFDLTPIAGASAINAFLALQRRLHDGLERTRSDSSGWSWHASLNVRKRIYRDFASNYGLTIPGENNEL